MAGTAILTSTRYWPIETIEVGDRVTTVSGSSTSVVFEPNAHRLVRADLELSQPGGEVGVMQVAMLRTEGWVAAVQAAVGSRIRLDIEELGVHGWARVTAVEPCPEIASGLGRVVTATFTHVNATVQRLELAAEGFAGEEAKAVEVLEPTAGHPLFSLTRGDWVKAGELVPGERLQTRSGVAQVLSVTASPGAQRVFNFEVEGEHEYLVGGLEVRSHNSCAPDAPKVEVPGKPAARKPVDSTRPQHGTPKHDATGFNKAKEWQGDLNTKIGADGQPEVRYNQALSDGESQLSNLRPDVQRARTDGKIDVVEVRSPTQTRGFMNEKVQRIKDILGDKAGDVYWVEPGDSPIRL